MPSTAVANPPALLQRASSSAPADPPQRPASEAGDVGAFGVLMSGRAPQARGATSSIAGGWDDCDPASARVGLAEGSTHRTATTTRAATSRSFSLGSGRYPQAASLPGGKCSVAAGLCRRGVSEGWHVVVVPAPRAASGRRCVASSTQRVALLCAFLARWVH